MMKPIKTVGIVGHNGMVGKTLFRYFSEKQHGYVKEIDQQFVFGYSLDNQIYKQQTLQSDLVFIAVPTPFDWERNEYIGDIVENVVDEIAQHNPTAVIVIKSTIMIGTTQRLQDKYPDMHIMFNPEFLSEASAYADFLNPDRQIVGYTKQSYEYSIEVLNMLPESAYGVVVPSKEAELLKYINNLHGFLSIMEANHYYDVCEAEGLDYERVIKTAEASRWIGAPMGRQYHTIHHKGFRGAGGKCFPKDINAWIEYTRVKGLDGRLMQAARDYNKTLLEAQGLTEKVSESK